MQNQKLVFLYIDLFCGAGGTTCGLEQARFQDNQCAYVIACVNHDPKAIASHKANHAGVHHFTEDVRNLDMSKLQAVVSAAVQEWQSKGYVVKLVLWASLECTNFSNAKGGGSRDADSRTLAEHLPRYITALGVDYVQIENVREFMAWGPLIIKVNKATKKEGANCPLKYDKKTKTFGPVWIPESRTKGRDYLRWVYGIEDMGFQHAHRMLNAADFGANTKRIRYFGVFARHGLPIVFPAATHSKGGKTAGTLPWRPAKEHIDFDDKGRSIFGRKLKNGDNDDLSPKSYARVFAGLCKYVAEGDYAYLVKHFSGEPKTMATSVSAPAATIKCSGNQSIVQVNFLTQNYAANSQGLNVMPVDEPVRTITTRDGHNLVQASFISGYNGGDEYSRNLSTEEPVGAILCSNRFSIHQLDFIQQRNGGNPAERVSSVNEPARTITGTGGNLEVVNCEAVSEVKTVSFIAKYYGAAQGQHSNLEDPIGTLRCKDTMSLIEAAWLDKCYTGSHNHQPLTVPIGAVSCTDHYSLVTPAWFDMQYGSGVLNHAPVTEPTGAIMANPKQCLMQGVAAEPETWQEQESDCLELRMIRRFMRAYRIADIKMRMLKETELLGLQGFPAGYVLKGTQEDKKKFIGNSVVPAVPRAWVEAMFARLVEEIYERLAA